MNVLAVIPARYSSQRLPGKPLLCETGKFLIQHTYERVKKVKGINKIIIATDDRRIFDACKSFGAEVLMTSKKHKSGTDRVAEVAKKIRADIYLNIQCDEPEIPVYAIEKLIEISKVPDVEIATLATQATESEILNPNVVKVVVDKNSNALYFSRANIPYNRDDFKNKKRHLKHLGIYSYKRKTLLKLISLGVSNLEKIEKLEQLRALENNIKIKVGVVKKSSRGIDTIEDYKNFVKNFKRKYIPIDSEE